MNTVKSDIVSTNQKVPFVNPFIKMIEDKKNIPKLLKKENHFLRLKILNLSSRYKQIPSIITLNNDLLKNILLGYCFQFDKYTYAHRLFCATIYPLRRISRVQVFQYPGMGFEE